MVAASSWLSQLDEANERAELADASTCPTEAGIRSLHYWPLSGLTLAPPAVHRAQTSHLWKSLLSSPAAR